MTIRNVTLFTLSVALLGSMAPVSAVNPQLRETAFRYAHNAQAFVLGHGKNAYDHARILALFPARLALKTRFRPLVIKAFRKHPNIAYPVYYTSVAAAVAATGYAGYKVYKNRGAIKQAIVNSASYVAQKVRNVFGAQPTASLDGIVARAEQTRAEMQEGKQPMFLASQMMFDQNIQQELAKLNADKRASLEQAVVEFDVSFTERREQRAVAVENALNNLKGVVNSLKSA